MTELRVLPESSSRCPRPGEKIPTCVAARMPQVIAVLKSKPLVFIAKKLLGIFLPNK